MIYLTLTTRNTIHIYVYRIPLKPIAIDRLFVNRRVRSIASAHAHRFPRTLSISCIISVEWLIDNDNDYR